MKQLSLIEKAFFLKKIELFKELDLDLLVAIAEKMHQDFYDSEEIIFSLEQKANRMFFIVEGSVDIYSSHKKHLERLQINQYFGEESLFTDKTRSYLAICKHNAVFLTLSRSNLMAIISECPSVAIALLQDFAKNVVYNFHSEPKEL